MQTTERDNIIRGYFENTNLTLEQIAQEAGYGYKIVWNTVTRLYDESTRKARKQKNYSISKQGDKNPMKDKTRSKHHNWIGGEVGDGNGYIMVLKPEWYTGRQGSKYVFKHSVVICEALGLTEIPRGWIVHHVDRDRTNNEINNLALMTNAAHNRLHQLERVTTIPQGSRA